MYCLLLLDLLVVVLACVGCRLWFCGLLVVGVWGLVVGCFLACYWLVECLLLAVDVFVDGLLLFVVACCSLFMCYCLVCVVRGLVCVVCWWLVVVCWLLRVRCCLMVVVYFCFCVLLVVYGVLFV